jgi:hypothetical protein
MDRVLQEIVKDWKTGPRESATRDGWKRTERDPARPESA